MALHYLDFDFSDEEAGRGSFDAMASVLPDRVPALLAEITAVLSWAVDAFGTSDSGGAAGDTGGYEGEWDYELQGSHEPDTPLQVSFDASTGEVSVAPTAGVERTTLTLTLSGSPAFCEAFRERFEAGE